MSRPTARIKSAPSAQAAAPLRRKSSFGDRSERKSRSNFGDSSFGMEEQEKGREADLGVQMERAIALQAHFMQASGLGNAIQREAEGEGEEKEELQLKQDSGLTPPQPSPWQGEGADPGDGSGSLPVSPLNPLGRQAKSKGGLRGVMPSLQRQPEEEDPELDVQAKSEEEEPLNRKINVAQLQRQQDEEEKMQLQRQPEEEEKLDRKINVAQLQRQQDEDELKLQRQPKEDEKLDRRIDLAALQRQQNEEELKRFTDESKEDELQTRLMVQPKLTIGQPGDKYEQEADRTAAQVMAMHDPGGIKQNQPTPNPSQEGNQSVQNPKSKIQNSLQAKGSAPAVPENFESQLAQHKGSGQPLSDEARSFMEPRFGADFSNVRVHETPDLANAIQAQAFTHGQDIYFNSGKYNPGSSGGKELLAHELTHVVQQSPSFNFVQRNPRSKQNNEQADQIFSNLPSGRTYLTTVEIMEGDTEDSVAIRALKQGLSISQAQANYIFRKYVRYLELPKLEPSKELKIFLEVDVLRRLRQIAQQLGSENGLNIYEATKYNISQGYSEETIKQIQSKVGAEPDGVFGPKTARAVSKWQADKGLAPDGKVGPKTYYEVFVGAENSDSSHLPSSPGNLIPEEHQNHSSENGQINQDEIVISFDDGWKPGENENSPDSQSLENRLLIYRGEQQKRKSIHEFNLNFLRAYFLAYNSYLKDYRDKVAEVKSEQELKKLGRFKPPQAFPLAELGANQDEYEELVLAQDSDAFITWKEISNKISHLRNEIPAGTLFLRVKFSMDAQLGIAKVSWAGNIDAGNNGYLKKGNKFDTSVDLSPKSLGIGENSTGIGGSVDEDFNPTGNIEVGGENAGIGYTVSKEEEGKKQVSKIKLRARKWKADIDSEGNFHLDTGVVSGSSNSSKGEAVVGSGFDEEIEIDDFKGKASLFFGMGFVGLSEEKALQALVGQGFFQPSPSEYENMPWQELSAHSFRGGLAASVPGSAQAAYTQLGFNNEIWSNFVSNKQSISSYQTAMSKGWEDLTPREKVAAIALGYFSGMWNKRAYTLQ